VSTTELFVKADLQMGTHAGNDLQQGMALSCIHFAILAFDSKVLWNVKREVAHMPGAAFTHWLQAIR
jgi:hypothetical protein